LGSPIYMSRHLNFTHRIFFDSVFHKALNPKKGVFFEF
jgi:hypothetical protein